MRQIVLFGIFLVGMSNMTFSQSADIQKPITITPNVAIQNIDWFERSTVGKVGLQVQFQPLPKINFTIDGSVFKSIGNAEVLSQNPNTFSTADMSGGKFSGNPQIGSSGFTPTAGGIPKTIYQGGFVNIDVGIPIKLGDSSKTTIEPFVGVEGKIWSRSADYGTEGNPLVFEEKYKFLSPTLGAKLNYNAKSKVKLSLRVSVSYPVVAKVKTDEKNLAFPNKEFDLTKMLSPSVELGAKIKKVTLKLRYERINIGAVDSLRGASPAANVTGVSIGYDF